DRRSPRPRAAARAERVIEITRDRAALPRFARTASGPLSLSRRREAVPSRRRQERPEGAPPRALLALLLYLYRAPGRPATARPEPLSRSRPQAMRRMNLPMSTRLSSLALAALATLGLGGCTTDPGS